MPLPDFLETLRAFPLVFDGATGTMLYERGVYLNKSFDEVSLYNPELVRDVHQDYIDVGVDVIQTNTFGSNRIALAAHGLAEKVEDICIAAVRVAKEAAAGRAWVAGSIGPTTLLPKDLIRSSTRTKAFDAFHEQISALANAGADALLFETFHYLGELEIAVEAAYHVDIPIIAQVSFHDDNGDLHTLDGAKPEEVTARLSAIGVDVIGVNCVLGPDRTLDAAERMLDGSNIVLMQPNAGAPQSVDGRAIYQSSPETFGVVARRAYKLGIRAVGGCCGTSPEHMRRVVGAARMMGGGRWRTDAGTDSPAKSSHSSGRRLASSISTEPHIPFAKRSPLAAKIAAGEFVVSVEMVAPVGVDPTETLQRIQALEGIADVVNIPDGPRATVRMSNIALARLVLENTNVEPMVHVCGRDRNLLAIQGDLLGAHALGIRNLVIVTGDPPKLGDYPDASAVFDLDSIGILSLANGLNAGIDPAHKPLPRAPGGGVSSTAFALASGAEPAALDFDREVARVRDKVEAGAEFIMTQPVFSASVLDRFLDAIADFHVPILVGVLPLASIRNATFLHEHVPGMLIPEDIRAQLAAAGDGREEQQRVGVELAAKALASVKDRVQGAYIMPPFGRVEMAREILVRAGLR